MSEHTESGRRKNWNNISDFTRQEHLSDEVVFAVLAFFFGKNSMSWRSQSEAPAIVKLAIASVLSAALGFSAGSGEGASQANSAASSSGPSKTAVKVRPLTNRKFERTPERLACGRYLVNGIGECFACHGPFDLNSPGGPPIRGKEGSGLKFSWWVAPNLTPDRKTGIGDWTDDMLARAIREGVAHDGHLLDPTIMPSEFYRSMSDEDLASIIVYLRSIPPIRNALSPMRASKNIVAPYAIPIYAPVPQPDVSTPLKRGAYLVQIGACQWCHTLRDKNRVPLPGLEFAGGDLPESPFAQASSANLTPDPSGISYYDEAQFLKTMHTGKVGARRISAILICAPLSPSTIAWTIPNPSLTAESASASTMVGLSIKSLRLSAEGDWAGTRGYLPPLDPISWFPM